VESIAGMVKPHFSLGREGNLTPRQQSSICGTFLIAEIYCLATNLYWRQIYLILSAQVWPLHMAKCIVAHPHPDPFITVDPSINASHRESSSCHIYSFMDQDRKMISIEKKVLVEPSTIFHPIEFQIYTQYAQSHPHKYAIFDGSSGEAADRPHLHFLVHSHDCEDRSIYNVVSFDDACNWEGFNDLIHAKVPDLVQRSAERLVIPRKRPRHLWYSENDEDDQESEVHLSGKFRSVIPVVTISPIAAHSQNLIHRPYRRSSSENCLDCRLRTCQSSHLQSDAAGTQRLPRPPPFPRLMIQLLPVLI
jgi:hypothetical protein